MVLGVDIVVLQWWRLALMSESRARFANSQLVVVTDAWYRAFQRK